MIKYCLANIWIIIFTIWAGLAGLISSSIGSAASLDFSEEEQQWLARNKTVVTGVDSDFAPYEWVTIEGVHKGMVSDFLALIGEKTGIEFRHYSGSGWTDVLEKARAREVDILAAAAISPQRQESFDFSEPYIRMPGVIISTEDYGSLEDLKGKKIAVVSNYVWDDLLTAYNADARIVRVEDTFTGVELTSLKGVDAMLSDPGTVSNAISKGGFTNLRISGYLEQALELRFAVRQDWPQLITILNRAISNISAEETEAITAKWIRLDQPGLWDNPVFKYSVIGGGPFLFLLIGGIATWNFTLRRQVARRTKDLRLAQQQLVQAEKMRTVGSLASGVAHEVKNPLAIIQMGIDFLNAEHADADEVERQVIDDMDDAITRANKVIMELLDLSRDAELSFSAEDVNEVINKSLHLVEYETRKHNISVSIDLDQNIPDLQIDSAKLQQVFINLFMNSVQAMGEDGSIQVKSRLFTVRKTRDADLARELHLVAGEKMAVIEVADSGPGIEAEQSAKLFDPFYTTKPVGEGTGLGLAISQKIIQMHCGTIMLGNRKEGGALARITLPIEKRGSCEKEDSARG